MIRLCVRAAGLLVCGAALLAVAAAPSPRPSAPRVRLAVVVAVDGLGGPRLAEYRPWFTAGFARLLDEGHVETACRYRHLNTQTAPGHASIGTGAPPRVHGIVGNHWHEAGAEGRPRSLYCTDEVGTDGRTVAGAANLRVPTLGDRLVAGHPRARVVSVSVKDRSAIFMAGRERRHAPYWWDASAPAFITSAAYDPPDAVRRVVDAFNGRLQETPLARRFGPEWPPLSAPAGENAVRPTAVPGALLRDHQNPSLGPGWNHSIPNTRAYTGSPFADTMLADLVLALLENDTLGLGRGEAPDLLAISFSAHDSVAHAYGPESEEALDLLRRLDVELGRVLDALDRRVGREHVLLGLSADHGFAPMPEAARPPAGRRMPPDFFARLDRALAQELCLPEGTRTLFGQHGWALTYERAGLPWRTVEGPCGAAGREVTTRDLDRVLPAAVRRLYPDEIDAVFLSSSHARWPADHAAAEFVRNAFDSKRSGDALLVPRPGVMAVRRGSTHGTHHDHDTHVPLLFWGGVVPARSEEASAPYDLAPTLARHLDVELPSATGRARLLSLRSRR